VKSRFWQRIEKPEDYETDPNGSSAKRRKDHRGRITRICAANSHPDRWLIRNGETVQGGAGRLFGHQEFDEVADPLYVGPEGVLTPAVPF
jgi:hypothetical protein